MPTAKERAAARMAKAAGGSAPVTAEPTPEPAPEPARTSVPTDRSSAVPTALVRTKPVRATVDLSPIEHRTLTRLRAELAEAAGLPSVAGAEVFRALLAELDASEREGSAGVFWGVAYRLIQRSKGGA